MNHKGSRTLGNMNNIEIGGKCFREHSIEEDLLLEEILEELELGD